MRYGIMSKTGALAVMMAAAAVLILSASSFAGTPTLGSNCGSGATIVGSDTAGKVTLGAEPTTCTLTFGTAYANPPACVGTNETNGGGGNPVPISDRTTAASVVLNAYTPWTAGDVISYQCQGY
jgi:hypothetical protein